jgi:EAL domain-containing protein (putative c-di-GMP-specific phosphodiesterase class I)
MVPESQLILVVDDDFMVTEGLAAGLERDGRTIVTCNDVESAQLMVERMHPSHVVADIRLTGPFGYEGLDFIRHVSRCAPESRVILMSGDATEALQLEASQRGAVAFLQKPFDVKVLDSTLDLMVGSPWSSTGDFGPIVRIDSLDTVLTSDALRPLFQPIVALSGEHFIVGYESLARFRTDSPLRNPEILFEYAVRKQRVAELECACIARTLDSAACLPPQSLLFMNLHPHVFGSGAELQGTLIRCAKARCVSLDRIVLEITEQASLGPMAAALQAIERLRDLGVRFAFDDVGVAYSHLPLIDKIRPSFLKISQLFGTAFETDPTKMKIVANLVALAADFNCQMILEGIERQSTADAAIRLGIALGQGFFFGRPAEASG